MANTNITTATTVNLSGPCKKLHITVGTGWTGTIVVVDNLTGSTPVVDTITNPVVGNMFDYYNFQTGVRIITTGTVGSFSCNTDGSYGPQS